MKILFVCEDSFIISPLFAMVFGYLCKSNALKIRIDYGGIDVREEILFDEEFVLMIEKNLQKKTHNLRELTPKRITLEMIENATLIFVANENVKKYILQTKMTTQEQIFPMTRRKIKFNSTEPFNSKKVNNFVDVVEKETFFLVERLLRHKYLI